MSRNLALTLQPPAVTRQCSRASNSPSAACAIAGSSECRRIDQLDPSKPWYLERSSKIVESEPRDQVSSTSPASKLSPWTSPMRRPGRGVSLLSFPWLRERIADRERPMLLQQIAESTHGPQETRLIQRFTPTAT
eukprot:544011-Hanusia_phi.AAC.2